MVKYVSFVVTGRHSDVSFKPEDVPSIMKKEDWGTLYLIDISDLPKINKSKLTSFIWEEEDNFEEFYPDDTWISLELFDKNQKRIKMYEGSIENDFFCFEMKKPIIDVILDVMESNKIELLN